MTVYLDCLLALIGAVIAWTFWPQLRQFARWLRGLHRVTWHRLTGRWPRYRWHPADDSRRPLRGRELSEWRGITRQYRQRGVSAPEPERRQQP